MSFFCLPKSSKPMKPNALFHKGSKKCFNAASILGGIFRGEFQDNTKSLSSLDKVSSQVDRGIVTPYN